MKKMTSKQRDYIIIGLCAVVLLMAVGYAAFSSQLNINGTAETTSKWNILITNVTSKEVVGSASNKEEPTWDNLTATFSTNLVSPGDSITYDITVENQGNLDAVLSKITLSDPNNDSIIFTTSGLTEGDTLSAGGSSILSVKVEYDNNVTTQPTNLIGSLTVTLDYEQKASGTVTPEVTTLSLKGVDVPIVTEGDGLYKDIYEDMYVDEYEEGRYVYKGADPDNYITFNGEEAGWRIMAVEADGTIQIMKNSSIGDMKFDSAGDRDGYSDGAEGTYCANSTNYGCNAWARTTYLVGSPAEFTNESYTGTVLLDSEINTYLNNTYRYSLTSYARGLIAKGTFDVGFVTRDNTDLTAQIASEKSYQWNGYIALATVSDYLKANTNTAQCETISLNNSNRLTCNETNWIFDIVQAQTETGQLGLLSPRVEDTYAVFSVNTAGNIGGNAANSTVGIVPVLFLKSDITLQGEGTVDNPYTIS